MVPARPRVWNDFPYPVAFPYVRIFDEGQPASLRRWALSLACQFQSPARRRRLASPGLFVQQPEHSHSRRAAWPSAWNCQLPSN